MYPYIRQLFDTQQFNSDQFFLMAGPCVVESEAVVMGIAEELVRICGRMQVPLLFKASYRKANRSRAESFTGIGDEAALKILGKVRDTFGVPVVTDIHQTGEAAMAAEYADVLQIPAFLCRQTDLLLAAAKTGRVVNVKKGQFMSAEAMGFVVDKIRQAGNENIILTERGTQFGYQDLIVDFRGIPLMRALKVPVVLDCTHSLQQPNQPGGVTGGNPGMIETMARAGIAAGADGLFIETHPDPKHALSDGANMLELSRLEPLVEKLMDLRQVVSAW